MNDTYQKMWNFPKTQKDSTEDGFALSVSGFKVVVNPLACIKKVPVRKHNRRHNQSLKYHIRIQKKWDKRFGTKQEDHAFIMADTMVLSPAAYAKLKEAIHV